MENDQQDLHRRKWIRLIPIEYLKVDNLDYYDSKAVSEEFAKHFSQVGKEYAQKIPKPNKDIKHYLKLIQENAKIAP